MSDDERNRRLEEARATLAEMYRQIPVSERKFASVEEAQAWLAETVGKRTYTKAELDKWLDDVSKFGLGGDTEQSQN
ncbi:MAG TPA: hypothetical protein VGB98_02325 [Pyrinomonadaceae bacterium]|jgi:hypothetical protein